MAFLGPADAILDRLQRQKLFWTFNNSKSKKILNAQFFFICHFSILSVVIGEYTSFRDCAWVNGYI